MCQFLIKWGTLYELLIFLIKTIQPSAIGISWLKDTKNTWLTFKAIVFTSAIIEETQRKKLRNTQIDKNRMFFLTPQWNRSCGILSVRKMMSL